MTRNRKQLSLLREIRIQEKALRDSTAHTLARAFRHFNRAFGRALERFGLSGEQAHILTVLWVQGPKTIGDLQRALALSSPTLTGAIRRMEDAGLVRREPNAKDRRSWRIVPVEWDEGRKHDMFAAIVGVETAGFSALSRAEQKTLRGLLTRVITTLEGD